MLEFRLVFVTFPIFNTAKMFQFLLIWHILRIMTWLLNRLLVRSRSYIWEQTTWFTVRAIRLIILLHCLVLPWFLCDFLTVLVIVKDIFWLSFFSKFMPTAPCHSSISWFLNRLLLILSILLIILLHLIFYFFVVDLRNIFHDTRSYLVSILFLFH